MDWMFVSSKNSYADNLDSSLFKFRDEASKEVIKVKWDHKGGALIPLD